MVCKIYKCSDRLPIKIGDIEFKISPLSFQNRSEIQSLLVLAQGGDMNKAVEGSFLAIKYALKGIKGVENFDGTPYELSFDSDGTLTDDCVSEVLNLECFPKLAALAVALINGVPDKTDLEGVTLLYRETKLPN